MKPGNRLLKHGANSCSWRLRDKIRTRNETSLDALLFEEVFYMGEKMKGALA